MSAAKITATARPERCWKVIGVAGGDRSCPELVQHVHCHNCPVFATAGRGLLERPAPEGYIDDWTRRLARPRPVETRENSGVLFRIGPEWLAVDTSVVVEVCEARPVIRLPHRRGLLAGMVSIRGELHLCVSLHELFDLRREGPVTRRRVVLIARGGESWALATDEVHGVHRVSYDEVSAPPMTVARTLSGLISGVFPWKERHAGWLLVDGLFDILRGSTR